jgi:hypothetical protein
MMHHEEDLTVTQGEPLWHPDATETLMRDPRQRKATLSDTIMPGLGFASVETFEPFYCSEDDAHQSWEDAQVGINNDESEFEEPSEV